MAAMAEPFDSFSACAMRSSRVSAASAHDSHARTLRDRPRGSRGGGSPLVNAEMGGSVMLGRALWLRCSDLWRAWGRVGFVEVGLWGEALLGTSSALPSSERRILMLD
jgi:hypothetical protein